MGEQANDYGVEKDWKGLAMYLAMLFIMAVVIRKGWKYGGK